MKTLTPIGAEPARAPLLRIERLKTYYPIRRGVLGRTVGQVKAVDDVTLDIYPGETIGLVGESGCGKSSFGRTIIRLEEPREGTIRFGQEDITRYSERRMRPLRRKLQMIFQDPYSSLNPRMRVNEILTEPLLAHGAADRRTVPQRVDRLLDMVGLPRSSRSRYPHEFSGGQRQRIGIARALSLQPELIVCDEPVSALDMSIQAQILNLLKDLQQELKLTYVFVAHGLDAVRYISDRIAVMYLGKIVELGDTRSLFEAPKHPYTRILLNANPIPDPRQRARDRIVIEGEMPSPANPPSGCRFHTRCPYAQARCRQEEPPLTGGSHSVACHYPLD
ncbi:ABC transporter ATP-binding protein [Cohnella sp. AR92]|uniref:ABC transporter ATP-binding protein n=1 Tax=Cohnella sp. AR92 TaxID=648716 RepID=UPI000F8F19C7|nr:oligopeptide/dipeptide ABC transporter ATP-binding protein [Cohnella sp. AR92]RUS48608.1 ATP-binding cassette domain-containing protein [Cohnella sp. AR92]